jgi:hypothetical protein
LSAQLKFAASFASEWLFIYEAFPQDHEEKEKQETIRQSDTRRSHEGDGEAQSGYVGKRSNVYGLRIDALVVENDIEK